MVARLVQKQKEDIRRNLGMDTPPHRRRWSYGEWLDEGMERSFALGMARLVGSVVVGNALATAAVYAVLRALGVVT